MDENTGKEAEAMGVMMTQKEGCWNTGKSEKRGKDAEAMSWRTGTDAAKTKKDFEEP